MKLTVERLMKEYGYSRVQAEKEVARENCEHDYGTMCNVSPIGGGCYRTCQKCGQMIGLGRHCWEIREERERKAALTGPDDT